MADFLTNLATRIAEPLEMVQPRLPSIFEPSSFELSEQEARETVAQGEEREGEAVQRESREFDVDLAPVRQEDTRSRQRLESPRLDRFAASVFSSPHAPDRAPDRATEDVAPIEASAPKPPDRDARASPPIQILERPPSAPLLDDAIAPIKAPASKVQSKPDERVKPPRQTPEGHSDGASLDDDAALSKESAAKVPPASDARANPFIHTAEEYAAPVSPRDEVTSIKGSAPKTPLAPDARGKLSSQLREDGAADAPADGLSQAGDLPGRLSPQHSAMLTPQDPRGARSSPLIGRVETRSEPVRAAAFQSNIARSSARTEDDDAEVVSTASRAPKKRVVRDVIDDNESDNRILPGPSEPIRPRPVLGDWGQPPRPILDERGQPPRPGLQGANSEPTIHVTIGRIEVRAVAAPQRGPDRERAPSPVMSLEEYLRTRAR